MISNRPIQVEYIQEPTPVRKKSYTSSRYIIVPNNQIAPQPLFTCIDEIYAYDPAQKSSLQQNNQTSTSSKTKPKETKTKKWKKWTIIIIIIIIIVCIIIITVLLAVLLTVNK
ncbi:unnamed protein product [Rotaria sordida]|uniref:Uncharacterized protein n=1 Tax=Rotaria sordida TaxID=392033 RepID=A0A813TDZ1_9BILA|nr:unnamed protein product [Rotaria sordida]CAF0876867.1 unnamed protein product [Rotaria sordida]